MPETKKKKERQPKLGAGKALSAFVSFTCTESQRERLDKVMADTQIILATLMREFLEDGLRKKGYPEKKPKSRKAPASVPTIPVPAASAIPEIPSEKENT
jgi:hypothetical protein